MDVDVGKIEELRRIEDIGVGIKCNLYLVNAIREKCIHCRLSRRIYLEGRCSNNNTH